MLHSRKYSIELSQDGFKVVRGHKIKYSVRWNDIISVVAYKRDQLVVDLICMDLIDCYDTRYSVSEDMEGFGAFDEELPQYLAGSDSNWREHVVLPPFQTSGLEVFHRATI